MLRSSSAANHVPSTTGLPVERRICCTSPANTAVYFFNISTYCLRNLATFGAITILQYGCIVF